MTRRPIRTNEGAGPRETCSACLEDRKRSLCGKDQLGQRWTFQWDTDRFGGASDLEGGAQAEEVKRYQKSPDPERGVGLAGPQQRALDSVDGTGFLILLGPAL